MFVLLKKMKNVKLCGKTQPQGYITYYSHLCSSTDTPQHSMKNVLHPNEVLLHHVFISIKVIIVLLYHESCISEIIHKNIYSDKFMLK